MLPNERTNQRTNERTKEGKNEGRNKRRRRRRRCRRRRRSCRRRHDCLKWLASGWVTTLVQKCFFCLSLSLSHFGHF